MRAASNRHKTGALDPFASTPSSKLSFLEALLACDSLVEAAQLGVDWLARSAGVEQVAILLVDLERPGWPRLVGAAAQGLHPGDVSALSIDLDERENPLVQALTSSRATLIREGCPLQFTGGRCTAYALPCPPVPDRDPVGLALFGGRPRDPEVQWVLGVLGRKLVDLRDLRVLGTTQNELLQRQAIELEAASSAKSQFLANMSHEFRTPLNAILGYTSMMLQGVSGPLPHPIMRQLTRIDSNGRHLLTILNDILDIARIEAGKMPLNLTRFAAADLVKEVLAELEPLIARSKIDVSSEIRKGVPMLRTDRAKVKQILMNLISNALKFTPRGSVTVSVEFVKRRGETRISVADTGIGIAEKDQGAVFQDFRQVDNSPTRQYGGTGLGLAICRRLANVLGGDIRLVSKVDQGSTFTLVLPSKGGQAPKGAIR